MQERTMTKILLENYSLGELEERLELTTEDLEEGVRSYVECHPTKVQQFLREDLWLSEES